MTRIDRRSLLKMGMAAGLAACGGSGSSAAAQSKAATPRPQARGTANFGLQFTGLFLCAYSPTKKRAILAVPQVQGHTQYLAADLLYVDPTSDTFDSVVAGPGGQQFGVWKVKNKGEITLSSVTGATIAPTAAADVTKCPPSTAAAWRSVSWLADVSKVQGAPKTLDETRLGTFVKVTNGVFGAVMPSNPRARGNKFVVVDEQDQDVTNSGVQLIDQPLANAIFYQGVMTENIATVSLPNGPKIHLTGMASPGTQAYFSNLPDKFPSGQGKRRIEHFEHFYTLLAGNAKKQYPGVGNPCDGTAKPAARRAQDGVRNIEPIFCPPGYVPEP